MNTYCDRTCITDCCVAGPIPVRDGAFNPACGRNRSGALHFARRRGLATVFMNDPG